MTLKDKTACHSIQGHLNNGHHNNLNEIYLLNKLLYMCQTLCDTISDRMILLKQSCRACFCDINLLLPPFPNKPECRDRDPERECKKIIRQKKKKKKSCNMG